MHPNDRRALSFVNEKSLIGLIRSSCEAHSGFERMAAKLCLTAYTADSLDVSVKDFPGQKRDKLGRFGEGKQSGDQPHKSSGKSPGRSESIPSATGANKLKRGFTPKRAKEHERHRIEQYPDLTKKQYEQRGIDLCEQPVGGDIDGFLDNAGNIFRYRRSTNELATGHPDGGLYSLYHPKKDQQSGYAYFLRLKASAEKSASRGKKR